MKKIIFSIIVSFFSFLAFNSNIKAVCYQQCYQYLTPQQSCEYIKKECTSSGTTNCLKVAESFCESSPKVSCGNIKKIPKKIPELTSEIITIVYVAVPIILVIMGSIDLFKGITAGKDDEIKKGQQMFIKRLVIGAIIFFVVIVVKFFISIVSDADNSENMVDCIECFVNGNCN